MASGDQRKRKRDPQTSLQKQQQIVDGGKSDGKNDGKNDSKDDSKSDSKDDSRDDSKDDRGECKQDLYGKENDDDAGHPSKRLKSQHPDGHENSQNSSTVSPQADAPTNRVAKRKSSTATDPSGAEINSKDRWLYKQLVDRTASLDLQSILSPASVFPPVSSAAGFDVVTSYNWLNESTIIVPGGAPAFINPKLPLKIHPDHGTFHIDMNASMRPNMPFEPMFRAIEAGASPFTFDSVDVVVNRNSLRQLFEFVKGSKKDSFKVQLHLVNDTLFITRREQRNQFIVDSSQCRFNSWGHAFEEECTEHAPGLEGSLSHHRAIRYQFGDLRLVVRHEVDATQPPADALATGEPSSTSVQPGDTREREQGSGKEHTSDHPKNGKEKQKTKVQRGGKGNPPSDLVEMKARPKMRLSGTLDQMWFGRTPHLINGVHTQGEFQEIKYTDCEPLFKEWEDNNQPILAKLAELISRLRQEVRLAKGNGLVAILVTETFKGENYGVLNLIESRSSRQKHNECYQVARAGSAE
ncbi:hypothetical protein K4K48_005247 [Colletotrichum sp. SAR 10_66]|nr:hypothetical protein K4K52_003675 [Colletotrichum sp. SAR 10_76]KAJ4998607.1 hypothetical protein K4K48_005247 [Colletotrichum sp. SAR 10_66]